MTSNPAIEIKITDDGSHTLFVPSLNENYHSWHGAFTESKYVFIEQGLHFIAQDTNPISIIEIGFGTGLNAVLSYQYSREKNMAIDYCGIELNPLSTDLINQLNYPQLLNHTSMQNVFKNMHEYEWNTNHLMDDRFKFKKIQGSALEFPFPENEYNLVYFDAFAPDKQPELWSPALFQILFNSLKPGGTLVTYCAKGQFKRDVKSVGFRIETLPGPPGKREMVRAIK